MPTLAEALEGMLGQRPGPKSETPPTPIPGVENIGRPLPSCPTRQVLAEVQEWMSTEDLPYTRGALAFCLRSFNAAETQRGRRMALLRLAAWALKAAQHLENREERLA